MVGGGRIDAGIGDASVSPLSDTVEGEKQSSQLVGLDANYGNYTITVVLT